MPKIHPIQTEFTAGEVSPRIHCRPDTEAYRAGVKILQNMVCLRHGPVTRRPGTGFAFEVPGTSGAIFGFEVVQTGVGGGQFLIVVSDTGFMYIINVTDPRNAFLEASFQHPWVQDRWIPELYAIQAPNTDKAGIYEMFFLHQSVQSRSLIYNSNNQQWVLSQIAFVGRPEEWGDGNWPSAAAFHKGRCYWGGVVTFPATHWASRPNDFIDLQLGDGQPDDGIKFTLSRIGYTQWMESSTTLLIGTNNGEHILDSESGVITPDDYVVTQQSANGSKKIQSELVGNEVLYVSPDGRKLRAVEFEWTRQSWVSQDITFASEHITVDDEIIDIEYAKDPESVIWMPTKEGNLLGCTYNALSKASGWHRHDTQGEIIASTTLEFNGATQVFFLVNRQVNSQTRMYLEVFLPGAHCDSRVDVPISEDNGIVVPHLAGNTVKVLVDGAVHSDVVLDASGKGVLKYGGEIATVGLGFTSRVLTLPVDTGAPSGSAMSWKKRWNSIYLRLVDSAFPNINGKPPPERSPYTPMGEREPNKTTDVRVSNLGVDGGEIDITIDSPLPLQITGIFGELSMSSL